MTNDSTSDSPFPASGAAAGAGTATSGLGGLGHAAAADAGYSGMDADAHGTVQRVARRAHEAVDRVEQAIGAGSERVMDWQQEYGDMAREQVRASPLAAVGLAFGVGILFSKLFMR